MIPPEGAASAGERWRFEAIGTVWEIETATPLDTPTREAVRRTIDEFDAAWSRFRPDSLVTALARGADAAPAPPDAEPMLDVYADLSQATGGAVNPLVGGALEHRGYDADLTFHDRGPAAAPSDWRGILNWHGGRLSLATPGVIDVGALGKGRLVDLVIDVVAQHASGDIVVDASGDLAVRGAAQRVGLEHPFDPARAIGVWQVTDAALCASAVNRRAWPSATGSTLHHVLDARTGEPVRTITATWAVADTAMRADAAATALFFDGGPELAHRWGVEWVRMTTDGRVEWSPGSTAELFV